MNAPGFCLGSPPCTDRPESLEQTPVQANSLADRFIFLMAKLLSMGRGLSELQKTMIQMALNKLDSHHKLHDEIPASRGTLPIQNFAMPSNHTGSVAFNDVFIKVYGWTLEPNNFFSKKDIGLKRYMAAKIAVRKAAVRLAKRGLINIQNGGKYYAIREDDLRPPEPKIPPSLEDISLSMNAQGELVPTIYDSIRHFECRQDSKLRIPPSLEEIGNLSTFPEDIGDLPPSFRLLQDPFYVDKKEREEELQQLMKEIDKTQKKAFKWFNEPVTDRRQNILIRELQSHYIRIKGLEEKGWSDRDIFWIDEIYDAKNDIKRILDRLNAWKSTINLI